MHSVQTSYLEDQAAVEQTVQLASLESEAVISLGLEKAINLALSQNPDLMAVRATRPVADAAYRVANTYPWNPQFQTQVLPYSRDRNGNDGSVSQQHVIVQTFELGGQQQFRTSAAAANWRQVNGTIRQAELLNKAQTTRLFFTAIYQRELREMIRDLAELNDQLVGIMQRRQQAGQANHADVELARLQAQSSRRQQRLNEANYQTAMMNLRTQLNLSTNIPLELESEWLDWQWRSVGHVVGGGGSQEALSESIDDTLVLKLAANRPDVVAARAAVTRARENMQLANAMKRPSLQAGPMWQRDDSATQFWGVQAQINLPVVNSGEPLVRQRYAELRLQRITASQLEQRAILEARAAIQRYERALRLVKQSRGEFVSDISIGLKPFEDQFRAGQISLLQVFAARTTLVQSQRGFLDLLNELSLAAADVTQATGLPPQQLFSEATPLPALPQPVSPDEEPMP